VSSSSKLGYVPNPMTLTPARFLRLEARLLERRPRRPKTPESIEAIAPSIRILRGGRVRDYSRAEEVTKEERGRGAEREKRRSNLSPSTVDHLLAVLSRSFQPGDVVTLRDVRRIIRMNDRAAENCVIEAKRQGRWPYGFTEAANDAPAPLPTP
jgi:hypothetical protein